MDIFYRRTGNDYKIHKIRGFSDDIPSNYSEDFSGIKVDIKGLNLYYIFNNRKFSYPAAFSQSTNQRRNAGTFIAGFSISKHHLNFDYTALPGFIQDAMNPAMKVKNIKYTNANIKMCIRDSTHIISKQTYTINNQIINSNKQKTYMLLNIRKSKDSIEKKTLFR